MSHEPAMGLDGMMDGRPRTQPIDIPTDWDEPTADWVASLKDDEPVIPDPGTLTLKPRTVSELAIVPGYTQSAWDRRQVRQLQAAMIAEAYLWDNLHKTDEVLVRDLLLLLGYPRAAHAHMATGFVTGVIYGTLATPPAKPKRRRPSQARKTVTGGK